MVGNNNRNSNLGCTILLAIILLVIWYGFARGLEQEKTQYEYNVLWVTSWIQANDDPDRPLTRNIGIMIASDECPDGAVSMNYEVSPEIYLDEFTEECIGGLQSIGGREYVNVMDHTLELRLQYDVEVKEESYFITDMTHDEFWYEIYDAACAVSKKYCDQNIDNPPYPTLAKVYLPVMQG